MHKSAVLLRQKYGCFASRSPMFCVFRTACFHPVQRRLHTLQASVFIKYFFATHCIFRTLFYIRNFHSLSFCNSHPVAQAGMHMGFATRKHTHMHTHACASKHALRNTRANCVRESYARIPRVFRRIQKDTAAGYTCPSIGILPEPRFTEKPHTPIAHTEAGRKRPKKSETIKKIRQFP